MTRLSVEYAHIYTNQHVNDEHRLSLEVLKAIMGDTGNGSSDTSLVVMVDDYSFPDPSFRYDTFLSWLEEQGYKPDLMIRESQLIPACDEVIKLVEDERLKMQLTDYIKAKKYPCSLFVATWYLVRFGAVKASLYPESLIADKLINILPRSFEPFEDKGLEIISATKYRDLRERIEYRFIEGRLIA